MNYNSMLDLFNNNIDNVINPTENYLDEKKEFFYIFIIFLFGFLLSLINKKNLKDEIKFITNKYFLLSFILIFSFCYYIFYHLKIDDLKRKKILLATKHALLSYVIAVFIKLDSILISPFIIVFLVSYFLDIDEIEH
tara:strand:+ start:557 stop:967 length:411 start_codon:yes stop_codon:yes gene_type:complete